MAETIEVQEHGQTLAFRFADMMRYAGGTAFQGPGARDGFEVVTRAVTDGRYTVDLSLTCADRGRQLQTFVFEIGVGNARQRCCYATVSSPANSSWR